MGKDTCTTCQNEKGQTNNNGKTKNSFFFVKFTVSPELKAGIFPPLSTCDVGVLGEPNFPPVIMKRTFYLSRAGT